MDEKKVNETPEPSQNPKPDCIATRNDLPPQMQEHH